MLYYYCGLSGCWLLYGDPAFARFRKQLLIAPNKGLYRADEKRREGKKNSEIVLDASAQV
jgi:hypothetical protein